MPLRLTASWPFHFWYIGSFFFSSSFAAPISSSFYAKSFDWILSSLFIAKWQIVHIYISVSKMSMGFSRGAKARKKCAEKKKRLFNHPKSNGTEMLLRMMKSAARLVSTSSHIWYGVSDASNTCTRSTATRRTSAPAEQKSRKCRWIIYIFETHMNCHHFCGFAFRVFFFMIFTLSLISFEWN